MLGRDLPPTSPEGAVLRLETDRHTEEQLAWFTAMFGRMALEAIQQEE